MDPQLFVFDMIGTTVEPSSAIPESFKAALGSVGVSLTDDQVASVRGRSKYEAIGQLLGDATPAGVDRELQRRVYEDFRSRLSRHYGTGGAKSIEGTEQVFDWCHSSGARVVLTTGFDREIAEILVRSLDWSKRIDGLICNDDVPAGRPAPHLIHRAMEVVSCGSAGAVASVGDTIADVQAARNAGVGWNFAVLTGAHDRERLSGEAGATVLESVASVPEYFNKISVIRPLRYDD